MNDQMSNIKGKAEKTTKDQTKELKNKWNKWKKISNIWNTQINRNGLESTNDLKIKWMN